MQAEQAGQPQSHPGLPQPHTLYICRTFRFALGHRNGAGSIFGAGHKASPGLALPMVCTILAGSPVSLLVPPAQQGAHEEGHSKSCLPWTSPWTTAKLPTLLSPYEPCQALAELEKPIVPSLNRCYHAQSQRWQDKVVTHHLPSGQGLAVDALQETSQTAPSPFLMCVPFLFHPVSLLMLLSLSCDTNHAFTPKATQRADFAL